MNCAILSILVLTIGLTQGSQFSRDESSEQDKTEFNLASTFTGGITTNRHHARAHLDSQLYPGLTQQPLRQPSAGYGSADIDAPSAHENGGTLDIRNNVVVPGNSVASPATSIYPKLPVGPPLGYPAPAPASAPAYPQVALHIPNYPANYPTQYQPQYQPQYPQYPQPAAYPVYPQPAPYPVYPGYPPQQPGLPANTPPQSYQNQQQYIPAAGQRDHFDRSFKMNTEYKEDGVHTGPFEVLNNHNRPGYGSGYGGGYNGAFNRPGY